MKPAEHTSFRAYLRACTDDQVHGVYEREMRAGRADEVRLTVAEMLARGLTVPAEAYTLIGE